MKFDLNELMLFLKKDKHPFSVQWLCFLDFYQEVTSKRNGDVEVL